MKSVTSCDIFINSGVTPRSIPRTRLELCFAARPTRLPLAGLYPWSTAVTHRCTRKKMYFSDSTGPDITYPITLIILNYKIYVLEMTPYTHAIVPSPQLDKSRNERIGIRQNFPENLDAQLQKARNIQDFDPWPEKVVVFIGFCTIKKNRCYIH